MEKLSDALSLFGICWGIYGFFVIYDWFEMANAGLGMVLNIVFDTFSISTKSGTLEALYIAEILQKYKQIPIRVQTY